MTISIGEYNSLTAIEKITRCKIQLGYSRPFWSYLVMHLKIEEDDEIPSIGVTNNGKLFYNSEFINELTEEELIAVLCHEVFHVAFQHLDRLATLREGDGQIWNVAADIVTNQALVSEGMKLPKQGIIPSRNSCVFKDIIIDDISNKTVETIYAELSKELKDDEDSDFEGFDKHQYDEETQEQQQSPNQSNQEKGDEAEEVEESEEVEEDNEAVDTRNWKEILAEASTFARQHGELSRHVERLVNEVLHPQVDWKTKLHKYIEKAKPHDYTYERPSKKSIASGMYIPSQKKENLELIFAIDTSGSINQEDYDMFISEVININNSFDNITIKLLTWNTTVDNTYVLENSNEDEIRKLNLHGGGGTNINCLFKEVNKKHQSTRLLLILTDGYFGEITEPIRHNLVWVLTPVSTDRKITTGEKIKLSK